ncbi:hypothetical protein KGF56_002985 [Candida oxycetoniae]|uniref:Vps72/YL1 C-terminal domain-containing protein n=1 Tax=Candida oxycetoniae TaxID=497107 RepID=A0AAI9SWM7_9ASCO|nr:uncharacterized protein KGF56_002985 [Candida oxycetoniae]KAI3404224.2 hypothetical protein KGF56_002985 [Candida oxycetoniae]
MSESSEDEEVFESLMATRTRRSNAGSRLKQLIELEEQANEALGSASQFATEDDENVNLLFQEDGEDQEFIAEEEMEEEEEEEEGEEDKDEATRKRKRETDDNEEEAGEGEGEGGEEMEEVEADDVFSDSDEDSSESDESEGERELQRQEKIKRRKKKTSIVPKIKKITQVSLSSSSSSLPVKKKRKTPLVTSESLLLETRRSSSRSSAVESKQALIDRLKASERRKEKYVHVERKKERELTQEERLTQAVETEKENIESLNRFKEQEIVKKERQRLSLLSKRVKLQNVIRFTSREAFITAKEEVAEARRQFEMYMKKRKRIDKRKKASNGEKEAFPIVAPFSIDYSSPYQKALALEKQKNLEKQADILDNMNIALMEKLIASCSEEKASLDSSLVDTNAEKIEVNGAVEVKMEEKTCSEETKEGENDVEIKLNKVEGEIRIVSDEVGEKEHETETEVGENRSEAETEVDKVGEKEKEAETEVDKVGETDAETEVDEVGETDAETEVDKVGETEAETEVDKVEENDGETEVDKVEENDAETEVDKVGEHGNSKATQLESLSESEDHGNNGLKKKTENEEALEANNQSPVPASATSKSQIADEKELSPARNIESEITVKKEPGIDSTQEDNTSPAHTDATLLEGSLSPNQPQAERKRVKFADDLTGVESTDPTPQPEFAVLDKNTEETSGYVEIFEGPVQKVARNMVCLLDFNEDKKDLRLNPQNIKAILFGKQSLLPASRRFNDVKTILRIGKRKNPYASASKDEEKLFRPVSEITKDSPLFDELKKLPRLGVQQDIIEITNDTKEKESSEVIIKTEAPTGLYLPNGNKKACMISGTEVKYFDPSTGIPYSSVDAYKTLKLIEQGYAQWLSLDADTNDTGAIDLYLGFKGEHARHAKGVPKGF